MAEVINFGGGDDDETEDAGPATHDFLFTYRSGDQVIRHGYLIVTGSFTAIGFGTDGQIDYYAPADQLKSVERIDRSRAQ